MRSVTCILLLLCVLSVRCFVRQPNIFRDPAPPGTRDAKPNEVIDPQLLEQRKKRDRDLLFLTIHKVKPGDPYYKIFNGNETEARRFTNMIWRRLLNRYTNLAF